MMAVISAESGDSARPFLHLQPIVDFLISTGNELETDKAGFYRTQGGWVCDFRRLIDYAAIESRFVLPPSIHFGTTVNAVLCDKSWAEIRGGITR